MFCCRHPPGTRGSALASWTLKPTTLNPQPQTIPKSSSIVLSVSISVDQWLICIGNAYLPLNRILPPVQLPPPSVISVVHMHRRGGIPISPDLPFRNQPRYNSKPTSLSAVFFLERMEIESKEIDTQALRRLRARHRMMLRLFIASLILVVFGLFLTFTIPPPARDWLVWLPEIGMILVAVLVILSFPFGRTPCPRCGKPFYVPEGALGFIVKLNLSYRQCIHCKFPLNSDINDVVEQPPERER